MHYDFKDGEKKDVNFADIGCGYGKNKKIFSFFINHNEIFFLFINKHTGGLLIKLSELYPDKLSLGMEIRVKVSDYVKDRIKALRMQHPNKYNNIACIRSNTMKYLFVFILNFSI